MDESTGIENRESQFSDTIHVGNHYIDTLPSKPHGFVEKIGIFKKGEIDRSGLPNERDGWYIAAIYIANPEEFYHLLKLVHDGGEDFSLEDLCEASRKVRHGGFHKLQIILLRHCELSPSFYYEPSDGEKSWQVIQICRLLNLLQCLDVRAKNPFAVHKKALIHYYRARCDDIRGVSYFSYFYGMLDKPATAADGSCTESLLELCAIRDKLYYGPSVYRAIAAIYAGSRDKRLNGFDGHKHLASPFLPTVHIEVFYQPSTKFTESGSPNPVNMILALKEAALQFNRYGKVLEPAETYDVSRHGSLDKWGIPNQDDLDKFANSGVWQDDWDLKTKDHKLSWPGKYPFGLKPAPTWNWGTQGESSGQDLASSEGNKAQEVPSATEETLFDSNPLYGSRFPFPSFRSVMSRIPLRYRFPSRPSQTATAINSASYSTSAHASPSESMRANIRAMLQRPVLPTFFRPPEPSIGLANAAQQNYAIASLSEMRFRRSAMIARARWQLTRLGLLRPSRRSRDSAFAQ